MRPVLVLLAFTSLAACSPNGDVTVPNADAARFGETEAGAYVLRSIAGKTLPADLFTNESVRVIAIADTLFLHGNGKGTMVSVERVIDESQPQGKIYRNDSAVELTINDGRFELEFVCNDVIVLAACAAPPHMKGAIDGTALNADFAMMQRVPQRFEKVAGPSNVVKVDIPATERLTVGLGGTLQLSARVLDAQGGTINGRVPSWKSLLPSVATVSTSGAVRGVARGITLISAHVDGRSDTVSVHVEP